MTTVPTVLNLGIFDSPLCGLYYIPEMNRPGFARYIIPKTIAGVTPSLFIGMATHYGLVRGRYSEKLRLLSHFEKEVTKVFQRRFSFNFVSASGHRFLLYTDTEPTDREDKALVTGTEYHVTFTVKAHIHDANKTTRIERCTFRTL